MQTVALNEAAVLFCKIFVRTKYFSFDCKKKLLLVLMLWRCDVVMFWYSDLFYFICFLFFLLFLLKQSPKTSQRLKNKQSCSEVINHNVELLQKISHFPFRFSFICFKDLQNCAKCVTNIWLYICSCRYKCMYVCA